MRESNALRIQSTDMILPDLPPVKPSAIALGTIFNHGVELAGMLRISPPLLRHVITSEKLTSRA